MHDDDIIMDDDDFVDKICREILAITDEIKGILYNSLSLLDKQKLGSVGYQLSSLMTLIEIIKHMCLEGFAPVGEDEDEEDEITYGTN